MGVDLAEVNLALPAALDVAKVPRTVDPPHAREQPAESGLHRPFVTVQEGRIGFAFSRLDRVDTVDTEMAQVVGDRLADGRTHHQTHAARLRAEREDLRAQLAVDDERVLGRSVVGV